MVWADAVSEYALLVQTSTLHHVSRWPWTPSTSNDLAYHRHVMANMNDARSDRASEVLYKMLEAGLTRDEVKDFISFIEVAIEEVLRDHIDTGRSGSHSGMVDGGWVPMEFSREGKLTGRRISGGKYHPEGHDFDIWPDGMPWLKLRPDTVGRGDHPSQARPVDRPARAPSVEICRRAGTRPPSAMYHDLDPRKNARSTRRSAANGINGRRLAAGHRMIAAEGRDLDDPDGVGARGRLIRTPMLVRSAVTTHYRRSSVADFIVRSSGRPSLGSSQLRIMEISKSADLSSRLDSSGTAHRNDRSPSKPKSFADRPPDPDDTVLSQWG